MGCDIHAHLEIKIEGVWQHHSKVRIGRDYNLFERMAGVRGDLKDAIAAPRGLPPDMTVPTLAERAHWAGDAHTDSWLSLAELTDLNVWYEAQRGYKAFDFEERVLGTCDLSLGYPDERRSYIQDARLVFWFDN